MKAPHRLFTLLALVFFEVTASTADARPIRQRGTAFSLCRWRGGKLELVPPLNFWSLCPFGRADYDYKRDAFALPKAPPPQVQLGDNCRAMVYGWKLRAGVELKAVSLETLPPEGIIGLVGVSVMNPKQ